MKYFFNKFNLISQFFIFFLKSFLRNSIKDAPNHSDERLSFLIWFRPIAHNKNFRPVFQVLRDNLSRQNEDMILFRLSDKRDISCLLRSALISWKSFLWLLLYFLFLRVTPNFRFFVFFFFSFSSNIFAIFGLNAFKYFFCFLLLYGIIKVFD